MGQSLAQIYLHIVFSTKGRKPYFQNRDFRQRVHQYLIGTCKNVDCPAISVGGVEDHVHVFCRMAKSIELSVLIRELKRESSKWIKSEQKQLSNFYWQNGYGAFSVSPSHLEVLREYIFNQTSHHKKETFQDEFRRLCKKYGVDIDERYVWD